MPMYNFICEVRNSDLERVGQIRPDDLDLEYFGFHNAPGSWTLTLPAEHDMVPHLRTPGSGLIVTLENGKVLFSGPTRAWRREVTQDDLLGTFVAEGHDDTIALTHRICYPEPTKAWGLQNFDLVDERTGTVENLLHAYTNANLGPAAIAPRRLTNLTMGLNPGRGEVITKRAKGEKLIDFLNESAQARGFGFRIAQFESGIRAFQTYQIVDRTKLIRMDAQNRTLSGEKVSVGWPVLTRALLAGGPADPPLEGDPPGPRTLLEGSTTRSALAEADWDIRIEEFLDSRASNDSIEHAEAVAERLAEDGFTLISAQLVPLEDEVMRFGAEDGWYIGDDITAVIDQQEVVATVTGVAVKIDAAGVRLGAALGDPYNFNHAEVMRRKIKKLERRLLYLESRFLG
jgi:hypothetical protein